MKRILVTGALGQIGSELVPALRERYGAETIVASDIRMPPIETLADGGKFEFIDCTNPRQIQDVVRARRRHHLSSPPCSPRPGKAPRGVAPEYGRPLQRPRDRTLGELPVFFPSSIGAFGPGTPQDHTPQDTIQRPNTMYGVTKVAGELLCDYYHRFGVTRPALSRPDLVRRASGRRHHHYAVAIFTGAPSAATASQAK